jgi:hypothetical protein
MITRRGFVCGSALTVALASAGVARADPAAKVLFS